MMTVLSLIYISPNAQVNPSRHSRAMAPITQDLREKEREREKVHNSHSSTVDTLTLTSMYDRSQFI